MSADPALLHRLSDGFAAHFQGAPDLVSYAPGRVNLIGEHTDYNDGFVLPCAIDLGTAVAVRKRADRQLRIVALDLGETDEFAIDAIAPSPAKPWSNYLRGVAALIGEAPFGADIAVAGNVPRGAGVSSSASLEVAAGAALATLWGLSADPERIARIGQRAEHEFAGCACGIMDQLVAARAEAGAALLIDCRSLACEPAPIASGAAVIVVDSGISRGLVGSAYNDRRRECETAALHYGVPALRDLDEAALEAGRHGIDPIAFARARHVVSENRRTLEAAAALRANDLATIGRLMRESHASMRDDFAITTPAIDALVEIAREPLEGEGGARMTGGGFGGCIVVIAAATREAAVREAIAAHYRAPNGGAAEIFTIKPSRGVHLL